MAAVEKDDMKADKLDGEKRGQLKLSVGSTDNHYSPDQVCRHGTNILNRDLTIVRRGLI